MKSVGGFWRPRAVASLWAAEPQRGHYRVIKFFAGGYCARGLARHEFGWSTASCKSVDRSCDDCFDLQEGNQAVDPTMSANPETDQGPIRTGLFRATTVVFAATVVSAVFGLLREILIASEFGTSNTTDTYFFAYEYCTSISLILLGGMAPALIAIYTASKRNSEAVGDDLGSTVINVYALGLFGASLLFALAAPIVGPLLASGFAPAEQQLVIRLMWCLTPALLLYSLTLVLKSLLEAEKLFFVSQVSSGFLAIGVITSVILFAGSLGVYCLPIGMCIGTSLQVAWTAFWLSRSGFRYRFTIQPATREFRRFVSVLWPGFVGALIMSVLPLIDRSMASHLEAGTVTCLSFAERPMSLVARFGLSSLITALLPTFAAIAVHEHPKQLRATVSQMLRILVFISVPLGILLAALRVPIIAALFERGSFDADSTLLTSSIFAALAIGLCPLAVTVATSTVFKSMQDTKTAAFLGGGSCLVSKVFFNFILIAPLGAVGLALATSLQYTASSLLLLVCLRKRLEGLDLRPLLSTTVKVIAASSIVYLVVDWIVQITQLPPLGVCLLGSAVGATVYLALAFLLKIEELTVIYSHCAESQVLRRFVPLRIQKILP